MTSVRSYVCYHVPILSDQGYRTSAGKPLGMRHAELAGAKRMMVWMMGILTKDDLSGSSISQDVNCSEVLPIILYNTICHPSKHLKITQFLKISK